MADETPKVAYVDDEGKTKERKAEVGDQKAPEFPEPLGTDPAALGAGDKEDYMTQADAKKADEKS